MKCNHNYTVISEQHYYGFFDDDCYTTLVSCDKCGNTKYISSRPSAYKWTITIMIFSLILIGLM